MTTPRMALELWDHQLHESRWLSQRGYGYVAADMGTGKTAAALHSLRDCERILVVCPIAVGPAWVKQVGLWDAGREACLVVDGSAAKRASRIRAAAASGRVVVVVNYDAVWRGEVGKAVLSTQWSAIVLDEAHRIKSPSGRASRWLAKLAAAQPDARRVCMSGTPCPHSPLDWWSQWRFLSPDVLGGSYTAFRSRIAISHPRYPGFITGWKDEALAAMAQRIDPHVYRIKADDVLTLPESIHTDLSVSLSPAARRYYDTLEEECVATVESGEVVTAANKLVVVTRLQQATSGFATTDAGEVTQVAAGLPPKAQALRDWLEDLPAEEPLVIFCKFIHDIDICREVLGNAARTVSELSGRKKELDSWQRGDTTALIVQQQAGGCGVDMTRACYAVYYSVSHSLGDFEQSLARLRRPGQTRPCRFYHLVATDTIDEDVYAALQTKHDVVESVLTRLTRRSANAR